MNEGGFGAVGGLSWGVGAPGTSPAKRERGTPRGRGAAGRRRVVKPKHRTRGKGVKKKRNQLKKYTG